MEVNLAWILVHALIRKFFSKHFSRRKPAQLSKNQYTDQEIISGCISGKRKFQELLYRQYYSFGMSVCRRYAPLQHDALEILNDSFMKVFENLNSFDASKPFKSWFRRIMVNTAIDYFRSRKRMQLFIEFEPAEPAITVEPENEGAIDAEAILKLFENLPEIFRITFNLYEVEGYNHEEIAGMLDISPGTSRSNLSRAKKMLRVLYAQMKTKQRHEAL